MDIKHNSKTKYFKSGVVEREIIIHLHLKGANIPDHCVVDMDFEAGDVYRLEYNGISNEVTSTEKDGAIHITDGTVDVYTKDTQLYVVSADENKLPHEVKLVAEEKFNEGGVEWEDIKNPPFGVKVETVEIVPEQSVTVMEEMYGAYGAILGTIALEVGLTYTVTFNGTLYELECYDDAGSITVGSSYDDNFKSYPFAVYNDNSNGNLILLKPTNEAFVISIVCKTENVTPIDPKFLPESAGGSDKFFIINNIYNEETDTESVDKSFEEILEAINNGYVPLLISAPSIYSYRAHLLDTAGDQITSGSVEFVSISVSDTGFYAYIITVNYGTNITDFTEVKLGSIEQ